MKKSEQIDPRHLLIKVAAILDRLGIDYMVTGGMSVAVWGRPRFTADIDIIIKIAETKVGLLAEALRKISHAGYIDEITAAEAVRRGGEFNFVDPKTGVKVDFWTVKVGNQELKRKKDRKILGRVVYFISPEDLILSKLVWYKKSDSTRHLEDAESVIKISGKNLDQRYLEKQAKALGVDDELKKLLK